MKVVLEQLAQEGVDLILASGGPLWTQAWASGYIKWVNLLNRWGTAGFSGRPVHTQGKWKKWFGKTETNTWKFADSVVTRKWKLFVVNGFECQGVIPTATEFLNSYQKWDKFISVQGLCFKVIIIQWNKWDTFNIVMTFSYCDIYLLNIRPFVADVLLTPFLTAARGEPSKHKRSCMKLLALLLEMWSA
jgi:hypothetical protein